MQPYTNALQSLPIKLDAMGRMVRDNPVQSVRLNKLRDDIDQRLAQAKARVQQRRELGAGALEAKYLTGTALQLMEKVRADVAAMTAAENQLLTERLRTLGTARRRSLVIQTVGGVISLLLLLTVFAGLVKQILRANRAEAGGPAQQRATGGREQRDTRVFLLRRPRPAGALAGHQRFCAGHRRGPRGCLARGRTPGAGQHHQPTPR